MNTFKISATLPLLLLCFCIVISGYIYSQGDAGQLFEYALYLEESEGNLKEAMALFEKILADKETGRSIAARTQLHIGICSEKLGMEKAKAQYEKVIYAYPEFKREVSIANERLDWLDKFARESGLNSSLAPITTARLSSVVQFTYELPDDQKFARNRFGVIAPAISPDGSKYVYSTTKGLYLRMMNEPEPRLIAGTDEYSLNPFFSTNGLWIGFYSASDRRLKKIRIGGGEPLILCDLGDAVFGGGVWNPDNTILYSQVPGGIAQISANGGVPVLIVAEKEETCLSPTILPDGKSVLFVLRQPHQSRLVCQSLETGERKVLMGPCQSAQYIPTGHIIYLLEDNLFAVPFDSDRLEFTGPSVPVVESVENYAISNSGTLVHLPGTVASATDRVLVLVDRTGIEESLKFPPIDFLSPRISPDGSKVVISASGGRSPDIWIVDLPRQAMMRLTFGGNLNLTPLWSPDGRKIVYSSAREGKISLNLKASDGTGMSEQIFLSEDSMLAPYSWSRDGKSLLIREGSYKNTSIGLISMEDFTKTPLLERGSQPQIAPNGRWVAYTSDEMGRNDIYVCPFPDVSQGKWLVSTNGGQEPLWSPDGRELFYRNNDAVMAVAVEIEPNFMLGPPKMLFRGAYVGALPRYPSAWDITPDGKRFLMMKPVRELSADNGSALENLRKINIVVNWFEILKARLPVP